MQSPPMLIYIHGFNSSPNSYKARLIARQLKRCGLQDCYRAPALTFNPAYNIDLLEQLVCAEPDKSIRLIGSSMGGLYAAYLAEKYGLKAVLVNPVVDAVELLRGHLGELKNEYTGEVYQMTQADLDQYQRLNVSSLTRADHCMLMVQTGDDVLNYQAAVDRYDQCVKIVQSGGSHGFDGFDEMIPSIFKFLGISGDQ